MRAARTHGRPAPGAPAPARIASGIGVGSGTGPDGLRVGLGNELRRRREEANVTREAAAWTIRASVAKIRSLEQGEVGFKQNDVADLLRLYGVEEAERDPLMALALKTREKGWWQPYADLLPSWFPTGLGIEQAASLLRQYELLFVPPLLMTREYARALTLKAYGDRDGVERWVEFWGRRQEVLTRADPVTLWAVIDEAVLRRSLGTPEVMSAQLIHLMQISQRPNVALQIVPFSYAGPLPTVGASFSLVRYARFDLPDVVVAGVNYVDEPEQVDKYRDVLNRMCATLAPPDQAPYLLSRIHTDMFGDKPG